MTNDERLLAIRAIVEDYGGRVMTSEAAIKAINGVLAPTPEERERGTSIVMFCDCPQKDFGLHKFDCQAIKELLGFRVGSADVSNNNLSTIHNQQDYDQWRRW